MRKGGREWILKSRYFPEVSFKRQIQIEPQILSHFPVPYSLFPWFSSHDLIIDLLAFVGKRIETNIELG